MTTPENKETATPAASAAPVAAPAAAVKPKPAAKEEKPAVPLVDNGNGAITDPATGLMWKKTDSWQDTQKFSTWKDHKKYVDDVNKQKFAGFADWRIPTKAEAATLLSKSKTVTGKNGQTVPIDPVFQEGCAATTWISECTDDKIVRFDFRAGVEAAYPGKDIWSAIRLVRKPK